MIDDMEILIRHLDNLSASEAIEANNRISDFDRGLSKGFSGAYKLTAKWLREILDQNTTRVDQPVSSNKEG